MPTTKIFLLALVFESALVVFTLLLNHRTIFVPSESVKSVDVLCFVAMNWAAMFTVLLNSLGGIGGKMSGGD